MLEIKHHIQQRVEHFDNEHGGVDVAVRSIEGDRWLFPDGARRDVRPEGLLDAPPRTTSNRYRDHDTRTWEILRRRLEYHDAKLHHLGEKFNQEKHYMSGRDYSEDEWRELERLKTLADEAAEEREDLLNEIHEHPIHKRLQAQREGEAERLRRIGEKQIQLNKLRL